MHTEEHYRQLPDGMTASEVREEFRNFISEFVVSSTTSAAIVALTELSDRQWHTYELLDNDIRDRVGELVKQFWSNDDANRVEALFGIAA